MKLLEKLAELADELDKMGHHGEADEIDTLLKDSGLIEWLRGKARPTCTCNCDVCKAGQARSGPHALEYHNQCQTGKCEIKNQGAKV
jgi:hypothetical protein